MKEWTIEEIQTYLKKNGRDIGEAAGRGHPQSVRVIELYTLHHKRPGDPGAHGLLAAALDELEKDRIASEEAANIGG
jgi:hypothetical protein